MTTQLTPHPVIPYRELFGRIAQKFIESPLRRRLFLFFCRVWLWIARPAKGEARIQGIFARGENGFATNLRPQNRFFRPEIAATLAMTGPADETPDRKAAKLIVGALQFRERALGNQLAAQYEHGKALDMQKYRNFFSLLLVSEQDKGKTTYKLAHTLPSEHIIVAVQGLYYKLRVLRDQKIIAVSTLQEQLDQLIAEARTQLARPYAKPFPFGLFTSFQDKTIATLFSALQKDCPQTIDDINNALFWVALDLDDKPQTLEQLCRGIHVKNYRYRDYRRSLQLVVTGNGRAGMIGDPSFGVGGAPAAHFVSELVKASHTLDADLAAPAPESAEKLYEQLSFKTDVLTKYKTQFQRLEKSIQPKLYPDDMELMYRFDDIKKGDFTRRGLGVDSVLQLAIHLAFQRCFGRVPNVGSFISLHSIQYADISRYNSTTPQVRAFVKHPDAASARAAVAAHKELIKKNKTGEEEIYQFGKKTMHMFINKELRIIHLILIFAILYAFIKDFKRRLLNQDVWVSSIPSAPGLAATSRAGVKLSFLAKPSFAGHYMVFDDHLFICFLSNPGKVTYCGKERLFATAIHDCLQEILGLLEKTDEPSAAHRRAPASPGATVAQVTEGAQA